MKIACEKCNAVYMISPKTLGDNGRNVKCAKCTHTWFVKPTANDLAITQGIDDAPKKLSPIEEKSSLPVIVDIDSPIWLKILPFVLTILILIISIIFHKPLISKIPIINYIYSFDLFATTEELVFTDMKIEKVKNNNTVNLLLKGNILNNSNEVKSVPNIRFVFLTKDSQVILTHIIKSDGKVLKAGEKLSIDNVVSNLARTAEFLSLDIGTSFELFNRHQ